MCALIKGLLAPLMVRKHIVLLARFHSFFTFRNPLAPDHGLHHMAGRRCGVAAMLGADMLHGPRCLVSSADVLEITRHRSALFI